MLEVTSNFITENDTINLIVKQLQAAEDIGRIGREGRGGGILIQFVKTKFYIIIQFEYISYI